MADDRGAEEKEQQEKGSGSREGEVGEGAPEPSDEAGSSQETGRAPAAWEADLDEYPLRDPDRDPRWAVRTVWGWVGFTLFSLAFTLVLLVLGFFYE